MTQPARPDPRILEVIDRLIEQGSAFNVEALEEIYDNDLCHLFVGQGGKVHRVARAQTISKFEGLRQSGEEHFSTERDILHIEQQSDTATALLRRRMRANGDNALFELRMRRTPSGWKIYGENVLPWPNQWSARAVSSDGSSD